MAARPGPLNLLTDVAGLRVGSAADTRAATGCTVVVCDTPCVAAVDVRGGAPGTRETDLLDPGRLVEGIDAVCLSGGSVHGLAAADGVVAALAEQGRGFAFGPGTPTAPIVPAAILFDLAGDGDKAWGLDPPYRRLGLQAARAASAGAFALGSEGAGYGARAGRLQGGLGSASLLGEDGITVAALAAVNSMGSVVVPGARAFWAWPDEIAGEFGGLRPDPHAARDPDDWGLAKLAPGLRENTTLAVVATDAALTPSQAQRLAVMAQDGLARAVRPAHTPFDGDVVFALSTARRPSPQPWARSLAVLGERAAACLARAVARGVHEARSRPGGPPAWRDLDAAGRLPRPQAG
ncbi:MAG: P1 family peptidase [Caulobacteraceae bacterium]|nr:P1 family peptidase [Caulobacter sp.]